MEAGTNEKGSVINFLTGDALVSSIRSAIDEGGELQLAVAYWGIGAAKRLGLNNGSRNISIICDARSLNCHPNELKKLIKLGADVRFQDGLHAKVYICGNKVIIGSANASTNGLVDSSPMMPEREVAVESSDADLIRGAKEWFEKIHTNSAPVSEIIRILEAEWRIKKKQNISILEYKPELFFECPIKIAVFSEKYSPYEQFLEDVSKKMSINRLGVSGGKYPFYFNTTQEKFSINKYEYMMTYWTRSRGDEIKINCDGGLWRVGEKISVRVCPGTSGWIAQLSEHQSD